VADCILALAQIGHHDTALLQRNQKRQILAKRSPGSFRFGLFSLWDGKWLSSSMAPEREKLIQGIGHTNLHFACDKQNTSPSIKLCTIYFWLSLEFSAVAADIPHTDIKPGKMIKVRRDWPGL